LAKGRRSARGKRRATEQQLNANFTAANVAKSRGTVLCGRLSLALKRSIRKYP
jgi:hypothetical protein